MKYLFLLFLSTSSISFVNSTSKNIEFNKLDAEKKQLVKSIDIIKKDNMLLVDCEFRVIIENEDGTDTEYHITVHDVSWWNCKKMQLGAWWSRNF